MKILRKRVGSFFINSNDDDFVIKEDSIYKDNEIIFNYLPIKNLSFFNLNIKKSTVDKKCWVYLDLNISKLYLFLKNGNILTNRRLLFELINSSCTRRKKFNFFESYEQNKISINRKEFLEKYNNKEIVFDKKINIFNKIFVKFGKVFFDLEKKLITINKCKVWKVKLPNFIILKNLSEIKFFYRLIEHNDLKNEPNDSTKIKDILSSNNLIIISKNDQNFFKTFFSKKLKSNDIDLKTIKNFKNINNIMTTSSQIIYSEDLNYQMKNYFNDISNPINEFLNQLKFESKNFFFGKKNIFILCKNLNYYSINYLANCDYKNLFILDSINFISNLKIILKRYDDYRIDYKDQNLIYTEYLIKNNIYSLNDTHNLDNVKIKIDDIPLDIWKNLTDFNFLNLYKSNNSISNFIKIGKKDDWSKDFIEKLEIIENNSTDSKLDNFCCPISITKLDSFSINTNCNHKFNLISILKWIDSTKNSLCEYNHSIGENNTDFIYDTLCPVCRNKLSIGDFKFNYLPDFKNLIKLIKNNSWIVITDDLWSKFINQNTIQISDSKSIILKTSELSTYHVNKLKNQKSYNFNELSILNLSTINNTDIKEILEIPFEITTKFISLISNFK